MRFRALRAVARPVYNLLDAARAATDGIALVETALIAPILAMIVIGTIDVANYGSTKLNAQQAVNRGLEMAMIGGPSTAASDIQAQTAAQAGVATSQVTVTQTLECAGTSTSWSSTCSSGQETARYVQIQLSTSFRPSFALSRLWGDANGNMAISATGVIRVQ
jgi:Flp pilus assembly protein TadG